MPSSRSTPTAASSESPEAVADTVVLRYFLLVDEVDLLSKLLGGLIGTPRIVFDNEEPPSLPDDAKSEITRSIAYQQRASRDPARDEGAQKDASRNAARLKKIESLHTSGELVVLDLDEEELDLVGRLTSPTSCGDFGLRFPLDPGEAACIAIGVIRGLVVVTDDGDALRALEHRAPGHPYERIRKLLIRTAEVTLCTQERANEIHREMRRLGFWDHGEPFPPS